MSGPDYDKWREVCWDNEENIDGAAICSAIYSRAYLSSYNSNVYALDWPQCLYDVDWSESSKPNRPKFDFQKSSHLHRHAQRFMRNVLDHKNYEELGMGMDRSAFNEIYTTLKQRHFEYKRPTKEKLSQHVGMENAYYSISGAVSSDSYSPCIEYNMADWLNLEEVQEALHVKIPSGEWQMCSDAVWDKWPDSDYDLFMQDYYRDIIENYSEDLDLKLCLYSGLFCVGGAMMLR